MGKKRTVHSKQFKAKVALEALKGLKTQQQLAAEFGVYPSQITAWKKELLEALPGVFDKKNSSNKQHEEEKAQLYEKIGRLEVENDWLKKKLGP